MFRDPPKSENIPPTHHSKQVEHLQLLASSVAHDFNNLLTSILGQSTLALSHLADDACARPHIEKAIKAAEFATALTNQLLAFSQNGYGPIETINLNQLIRDNLSLLSASFLDGISLNLELASGILLIKAPRGHIQQVVMNLLINAAEAIHPKSGTIAIRTGTHYFTEEGGKRSFPNGRNQLSGHFAFLQVQDDGIGMDALTMDQIFEPYFTTKLSGRGLGLSTISEIIQVHKGTVVVDSQLGQGTKFTVYLPCNTTTQFTRYHLQ